MFQSYFNITVYCFCNKLLFSNIFVHLLRRLQRFASGLDQREIRLLSVVVVVVVVVAVVDVVVQSSFNLALVEMR